MSRSIALVSLIGLAITVEIRCVAWQPWSTARRDHVPHHDGAS